MFAVVAASLLITGCASTTIAPENKASLHKVAIARQIDMPARPTVFGSSAGGAFFLGGPLGVMINQSVSDLPGQFALVLSTQQIDVRELMRLALKDQLRSKGLEVVDNEEQADAILKATIGAYGLTGNILSSEDKRFPLLSTKLELVRRNSDQVIWKKVVSTNVVTEIIEKQEQRPLADYFKDVDLLKREHEKVTALVAAYAFRDF
jgi:hypothetical protein